MSCFDCIHSQPTGCRLNRAEFETYANCAAFEWENQKEAEMAYDVAQIDGWTYWQTGNRPRAFKTRGEDFHEFKDWQEMADEIEGLGGEHPWRPKKPQMENQKADGEIRWSASSINVQKGDGDGMD